jgi:hypothetical protein
LKEDHNHAMYKMENLLRQEFVNKAGQAEKQQFFYAFDKWRMINVISKKYNGVEET